VLFAGTTNKAIVDFGMTVPQAVARRSDTQSSVHGNAVKFAPQLLAT
jgi:hypothetical protein